MTNEPDMSTFQLHAVEDEEFGLGAEEGGVAHAGGLQVGLGALGDRARVAVVALAVGRLDHVALRMSVVSSVNGSMLAVFGSGISSMSDASMPFQPAIDEPSNAWPSVNLSSSKAGGNGHVLFFAAGVGETEVDELDLVVLHLLMTSAPPAIRFS